MNPKRIVVIGVGGIGSHFAPNLVRMISHMPSMNDVEVLLVDGDRYVDGNKDRQVVRSYGNKAKSTAADLVRLFRNMQVRSIPLYVSPTGVEMSDSIPVSDVIEEGDWVCLCVDNNKTRLWVSEFVQTLENVVLLDGGNELMDGSVQIHIRQNGIDLTPPMEVYNPGISNPQDHAPQESCEAAFVSGETQLLITNLMVATIMLARIWCLLERQDEPIGSTVTFFDLEQVNSDEILARSDFYPVVAHVS